MIARNPRRTGLLLAMLAAVAACGGGGGSSPSDFHLSGLFPAAGTTDAPTDTAIVVTFNRAADLSSVGSGSVSIERGDGDPVAAKVRTDNLNPASIYLEPFAPLARNEIYRVKIAGTIRGSDGDQLGQDLRFCFITESGGPTVRPDQVVDLGNALNEPRYLARGVRLADGRGAIFGGYRDADTVNDSIEIYDPETHTFTLLPVRMRSPRAEHTATLLSNGRILLAGGVAVPGGEPLASTEIFDPRTLETTEGPTLTVGRRAHAACDIGGGAGVIVSGGIGAGDVELDSVEVWTNSAFELLDDRLTVPTAHHEAIPGGGGRVYLTAGNFSQQAHLYSGGTVGPVFAPDIRFRPAWVKVDSERVLIVGGDTRSVITFDFAKSQGDLAGTLLFERRGAHSLTRRTGNDFLVAGGFNIARQGEPALASLEIVRYFPPGATDPTPDATVFWVENVELPVPFAGHVAFTDINGVTVLAGGVGDGTGPHSRRVVLILDDDATPPLACDPPAILGQAR